jgi:hypothetical protein
LQYTDSRRIALLRIRRIRLFQEYRTVTHGSLHSVPRCGVPDALRIAQVWFHFPLGSGTFYQGHGEHVIKDRSRHNTSVGMGTSPSQNRRSCLAATAVHLALGENTVNRGGCRPVIFHPHSFDAAVTSTFCKATVTPERGSVRTHRTNGRDRPRHKDLTPFLKSEAVFLQRSQGSSR